ncbi:MAG: bestrophin family ion channel [Candidatus Eremiobacterota bacterium]
MPRPPEPEPERKENWFFLLFLRGYHFPPGMFWSMLTLGTMTAIMCLWQYHYRYFEIKLPLTLHGLLGFVVSLLLVFRTNSAYERWWEGRRLLGQLNDNVRYLVLKVDAFVPEGDRASRNELATWLCAFVWSLKEHLRQDEPEFSSNVVPLELRAAYLESPHRPLFLLQRLNLLVARLYREKALDQSQLRIVEGASRSVSDVVGGCERIKSTPIPLAYTLHLRRIILLYVGSLPFGLIYDYHWWAIPVVMAIFYVMAGIEFIGEEIEDPFGGDANDLPVGSLMARICDNISALLAVTNPTCPAPEVAPTESR